MKSDALNKQISELLDREYESWKDISFIHKVEITKQEELWLTQAILSLPEKIQFALYGKYEFGLSYEDIESFYNINLAQGMTNYYRMLFSQSLNIEPGSVISEFNMKNAVHEAVMKTYNERKTLFDYSKLVLKRVAVVLVVATLSLGIAMSISSDVRAAVITFIVEIYEAFTDFEVINTEDIEKNADEYTLQYVPDGYSLDRVFEEEDYFIAYYVNEDNNYFEIFISTQDTKTSLDTEGAIVENSELDGYEVYTWQKNNINYIVLSDRNALITVSGTTTSGDLENIILGIK